MRFTPWWRKAVQALRVVTAVGWLGSDVVLLALGAAGLSGVVDKDVAYPAMGFVGGAMFVPLSVVLVVSAALAACKPWERRTGRGVKSESGPVGVAGA
ncbi:hypothetical protein AB0J72_00670 [Dactylosporangium sp. NPDC049742]|uniref:hypothetical protein n=1 Tax=Dactylosporangium sp. NPDC049742 TaxID=3154737 RepID=UPI00342AA70A